MYNEWEGKLSGSLGYPCYADTPKIELVEDKMYESDGVEDEMSEMDEVEMCLLNKRPMPEPKVEAVQIALLEAVPLPHVVVTRSMTRQGLA